MPFSARALSPVTNIAGDQLYLAENNFVTAGDFNGPANNISEEIILIEVAVISYSQQVSP
jgi:hypothetical protein